MASGTTYAFKPSSTLRHAQSLENISWNASPQKHHRTPLGQEKPSWAALINGYEEPAAQDGMGSSNSLHRSDDFGQGVESQNMENYGSNEDLVSPSVRPFENNPSLPATQRDIVGNNLNFKTSPSRNNWLEEENDQLAALLLYRDALKRNLTTGARAGGGLPKMRHGRVGSQWRHVKQTNTYSGSNLMFIDGSVRIDDTYKYPIPRFGYPPHARPQHQFSSSYNDLSNLSTKSLDATNWSGNDSSQQRSYGTDLSRYLQYPNRNRTVNHSFDEREFREVKVPNQEQMRQNLR